MTGDAQKTEILYRPDIDGLRGIAILSVVAYHTGLPWITGGFAGVDVFFVISGFLITRLLLKEAHASGTISIGDFYARRVRRLLPALATVIVATLILGGLLLPHFGERQALAKSASAALVFVANQYFLGTTGGYFDGPSDLLPLLHLWSLSVEEQFYLVWPLILIGVVKLSPPETRLQRLRILLAALLAASFAMSCWLLRSHPQAAFFILPSRAWELALGALLATVPATSKGLKQPAIQYAATITGAALLAWAFFGLKADTPFPGMGALTPVIGSALLISGGIAGTQNLISRFLATRPLVTLGLLSYSWYLWHWPLLSIVRSRRIVASDVPLDCALVLIALACAALTVRFVENPIRHHRGFRVEQRKVLAGGLITLVTLLAGSAAFGVWAKYRPSRYTALAIRERPPLEKICMSPRKAWDARCVAIPRGRSAGESPLAVIWGDSHADSWAAAVHALAKGHDVEVRELSHGSCPPLVETTISSGMRTITRCRPYNNEVIAGLTELRHANPNRKILVVLAARWPGYLGVLPIPLHDIAPQYPRYYSERKGGAAENLLALRNGLRRTLTELRKLNVHTAILADGPEFRIAPVLCADLGYTSDVCDQSLESIDSYRGATMNVLRQVAGEFEGVHLIDPIPFFCPGEACTGFIKGRPVVYDDSHISLSGARAFAPRMGQDFNWLLEAGEVSAVSSVSRPAASTERQEGRR